MRNDYGVDFARDGRKSKHGETAQRYDRTAEANKGVNAFVGRLAECHKTHRGEKNVCGTMEDQDARKTKRLQAVTASGKTEEKENKDVHG